MDMIWRLVLFLGGMIAAAISRLFADEIKAWTPRLVSILINRAVSRLPASQKERFEEEWRSHLEEMPGEIGKVIAATGLQVAAFRITSSCAAMDRAKAKHMRVLQSLQSQARVSRDERYLRRYLRIPYAGVLDLIWIRSPFWYLRTVVSSWLRQRRGLRKCRLVIEYALKSISEGDLSSAQALLSGAKWAMDEDCVLPPDPELYSAYSEALAQLQLQSATASPSAF